MRKLLLGVALAIALQGRASAATDGTKNVDNLQCMLVMSLYQEGQEPIIQSVATLASMYFAGQVFAADPHIDLNAAAKVQAPALTPQKVASLFEECFREMKDRNGQIAGARTILKANLPPVDQDELEVGTTFHGGPFDGLITANAVSPKGTHYVGFAPSLPNSSPIPSDLAPVVKGVIEAFVKNRPELYRQYAQPDAQSYLECQIECENHFPFVEDGFLLDRAEKLTANTPYYMGDGMFGPSIRIEWLHEGEVWYLSFLQFRNGKVSRVNTIRAAVPLLLPAPAQPDEAPSTNATPGPK